METSSMTVMLLLFWAPEWIREVLGNFGISLGLAAAASGLPTADSWSDRGTAVEAVTSIAAVNAADIP